MVKFLQLRDEGDILNTHLFLDSDNKGKTPWLFASHLQSHHFIICGYLIYRSRHFG